MDRREKVLAGLDIANSVGIEIGALCRPLVNKSQGRVIYVDHADTETLRQKYTGHADVDLDKIVEVDVIWGQNTLLDAVGEDTKVDYIIASHVIEHVPDLITWLKELRSVVRPTGYVRLVVPDRRYSFDYLRKETVFATVMRAHLARARVPQPQEILDHVINVVEIDCQQAWAGPVDAATLRRMHTFEQAVGVARDAIENGTYHDVHCWVFTPRSFALLMSQLVEYGLIDFACDRFCDTERNQLEFVVSMQPASDKRQIAESWQRMADAANAASHLDEIALLRDDICRLEAALQQQGARSAEEVANRARVEAELSAALSDLQTERNIRSQMEQSKSWKLTRPLRDFAALLRRGPARQHAKST